MPQTILYTDAEENQKIIQYQKHWDISKAETMKRMIREFKEEVKEEIKEVKKPLKTESSNKIIQEKKVIQEQKE